MSFNLRRRTRNFSDIDYNFHVLDWLLRGHLDDSNIRQISAGRVEGVLEVGEIVVGGLDEDVAGKLTHIRHDGIYTGKIYANQIELGGFEEDEEGRTQIRGGYLNTDVIEAGSITTQHLSAKSVTAEKISISNLLQITTDLGGGGIVLSVDGLTVYDDHDNMRVHIGRIEVEE